MSRKLTAEALGTLILVATVVGSGIMAETLTNDMALALWGNTAATGAILFVLITVFGPISGAHFNPAVTFAFWLRKEIDLKSAGLFVLVQVFAGICGTLLAHAMFEQPLIQEALKVRSGPSQWVSEFVATFALMLAIFGCIRFKPEAVPTAVGLVITAGYWWTSSTSFANPAVAIARAFTNTFSGIRPVDVPVFILMQMLAAMLAILLFRWLFSKNTSS